MGVTGPVTAPTSAAKRRGLLGTVRRALHIELPRAARREHPQAYGTVLTDFLGQAARVFGT